MLIVEYVGTSFHGSQRQDQGVSRSTVQSELEAGLAKLAKHSVSPPTAIFCGRTDAGVHATASVAHVDLLRTDAAGNVLPPFTESAVLNSLNQSLPSSRLGVVACRIVPRSFHAKRSARERTYVYRIRCSDGSAESSSTDDSGTGVSSTGDGSSSSHPPPPPLHLRSDCCPRLCLRGWLSAFDRHRALCLAESLDIVAMRAAAEALVGEHDFSSLRSPTCAAASPVRNLFELRVVEESTDAIEAVSALSGGVRECPRLISVVVRAPSFLKNMVRRIVAVLLEAGRGRMGVPQVHALLEAKDPLRAPVAAAAHGLYLVRVVYPPEAFVARDAGGGTEREDGGGDDDDEVEDDEDDGEAGGGEVEAATYDVSETG